MNNNNNKPLETTSKDKTPSKTRVFARLISRSEIKRVSGASKLTCKFTEVSYDLVADCHYE